MGQGRQHMWRVRPLSYSGHSFSTGKAPGLNYTPSLGSLRCDGGLGGCPFSRPNGTPCSQQHRSFLRTWPGALLPPLPTLLAVLPRSSYSQPLSLTSRESGRPRTERTVAGPAATPPPRWTCRLLLCAGVSLRPVCELHSHSSHSLAGLATTCWGSCYS